MKVYFEDFKEIVQKLEDDRSESECYLDSVRNVDYSIAEFVSENKYTNIYYWQNRFILQKFLGKELFDWIEWYLYELPCFDTKGEPNCSIDGVRYFIKDFDSFMDFARHGLCLPMKPGTQPDENEETSI